MEIKVWHKGMSDKETADIAYWERNMLALLHAEGWYNDDVHNVVAAPTNSNPDNILVNKEPRCAGWRRVLSLEGGRITFHIPDDFDVGHLPQIEPNWDGHTTEDKWRMVARRCGIK